MKNPFIQMSVVAAAAQAIFNDMVRGFAPGTSPAGRHRHRSRVRGPVRPAGSKLAKAASLGRLGVGQPR